MQKNNDLQNDDDLRHGGGLQNLTTFLDNGGDAPILKMSETGVTYTSSDVLKEVSAIARLFRENGIRRGDRILIYLNNSAEYLFSYFAAWRMSAVAVPTNRVLTAAELSYIMKQADVSAVVTDEAGVAVIEKAAEMPEYKSGNGKQVRILTDRMIDALEKTDEMFEPVLCPPETVCQIQYTSGTTGKPKGAMLTQGGWAYALKNAAGVLELGKDDVYLGIYPMAHVGLVWGIAAMSVGSLFVEMERYEFSRYADLIAQNRVTIAAGMPPVIHSLLAESRKDGEESRLSEKMSTVRGMISGGGVLHHEIWKPFHERFGIPVYNAYGLSETIVVGTGTCIIPSDYPFADRFQSVGRPTPGTELRIVDPDDAEKTLPDGEIGEVALRGPAVAAGYWNMPEESEKSFRKDGWFLTGDMGVIDENGRLSIVDRKKEMIVMSGWKIYPTEVESVLLDHPAVADVAVFAVPDPHRYEIPAAAVVLKENAPDENLAAALTDYCRENLAVYKVPRAFHFVAELPRVNGWKLLRRDLREKYGKK